MTIGEKTGLMIFITGMGILIGLYVLGGGDASNAIRNGGHISITLPFIYIVIGAGIFLISGKDKK